MSRMARRARYNRSRREVDTNARIICLDSLFSPHVGRRFGTAVVSTTVRDIASFGEFRTDHEQPWCLSSWLEWRAHCRVLYQEVIFPVPLNGAWSEGRGLRVHPYNSMDDNEERLVSIRFCILWTSGRSLHGTCTTECESTGDSAPLPRIGAAGP